MTRMPTNEQADFVYDYFIGNENDLRDSLEIIGNILVQIGVDHMDIDLPPDGDVVDAILEDRKINGETIANGTAVQGLTLLTWLGPGES